MPADSFDEARDAQAEYRRVEVFDVPPACWDSVMHFLKMQTQWRTGGMGGITGFDYAAVMSYLREVVRRREERLNVFADLQAMEVAALEVMNRSKGDGNKGGKSTD